MEELNSGKPEPAAENGKDVGQKTLAPNSTLRDAIRLGLADKWTLELEDALFWPLAEFMDRSCRNTYESGKRDALAHLRQAGMLPS